MSLISLVVMLMVVGLLLWLVNSYLPMDPKFKKIVNVVVVVAVVLWVVGLFVGGWGTLPNIRIGR
jgi:uncharacterized BrkB/YihY/UPF0761 family membrane protein